MKIMDESFEDAAAARKWSYKKGAQSKIFHNNKVPMNSVHKLVGVSLSRSGIYINRKTPSPQLKGLS